MAQDLPFLTESGSEAFDRLFDVRHYEVSRLANSQLELVYYPQTDVIRHSVNVLIGLSSSVYLFNKV